ncbi:MAG: hypothetical protein ACK4IX_00420 [Candidatus Sericytochromatia bacterium]
MSKHLEFFTDLVFNREDLNLDSDFLGNEELKAKGFVLVPYEDELVYWLSEIVEENDFQPVFEDIFISKNTFVSDKLRNHKRDLVNYLLAIYQKDNSIESEFFNEINKLGGVFRMLHKNEYKYSDIIKTVIIELVNEIKVHVNILDKNIERKLSDVIRISKCNSVTYFKVKSEIKSSFINNLQMLCGDLGLINDADDLDDNFYNVLTSNKIDENTQLKFEVDNITIAVFFDEIAPFYDGLTYTQIEKCGMFFNKQGKPIKATDLYAAKSRIDISDNNLIKNLKEEISELKLEYLK